MTRDELAALEDQLSELLEEKRRVGEFDASAGAIVTILEAVRDITHHLQQPPKIDAEAAIERVRKLSVDKLARGRK